MILIGVFLAATLNEVLLAAWTSYVAHGQRTKAVLATLLLEAVRLPTLILVASAPMGSSEQIIRGVVATFGYCCGTYIMLSFGDKK